MKTLVVYESMWGNTEKVARAVARGLEDAQVPSRCSTCRGRCPDDLAGIDLLVVGGPTHAFSMSRPSTREDAVDQGRAGRSREPRDPRVAGRAARGATSRSRRSTPGWARCRHLPGSAAKKAAKEVRRHHLGRVVDTESFYVDDMAGPLLDGELDRAEAWGRAARSGPRCRSPEDVSPARGRTAACPSYAR